MISPPLVFVCVAVDNRHITNQREGECSFEPILHRVQGLAPVAVPQPAVELSMPKAGLPGNSHQAPETREGMLPSSLQSMYQSLGGA